MAQDTRTALMDAAEASFATDGFAGTSIRALTRAVGIKESSFYNHFPSKQALLDAVLDRAENTLATVAERMHVPFDDPDAAVGVYATIDSARLEAVCSAFMEAWLHDPHVVAARRVLTLEQYRSPAVGERLRAWTIDRPLEFQSELFRGLIDAGTFLPADPDAVALAFWGPILTAMMAADAGAPEDVTQRRMLDHLKHFTTSHVATETGAQA